MYIIFGFITQYIVPKFWEIWLFALTNNSGDEWGERERGGGGKERAGGTAKENINITGANWHCSFPSYLPAYPERAVYNISRFHHTRMHVGSTIERRRICFKRALLWIINSLQASVSRCLCNEMYETCRTSFLLNEIFIKLIIPCRVATVLI